MTTLTVIKTEYETPELKKELFKKAKDIVRNVVIHGYLDDYYIAESIARGFNCCKDRFGMIFYPNSIAITVEADCDTCKNSNCPMHP